MTPILILDLDNTIKGEFYLDNDTLGTIDGIIEDSTKSS